MIRYRVMLSAKRYIHHLASKSKITINGSQPYDIQVYDDTAYRDIYLLGRVGVGESFMANKWDSDDLVESISRLISSGVADEMRSLSTFFLACKTKLFNLQSRTRAFEVARAHYDFGNELYEVMLDSRMVYTCADFQSVESGDLESAQEAKLKSICDKLDLKPGKRLLDVGCGWGSLMKYAAEHYGVECVGISVSREQTQWAHDSFGDLPCTIEVVDYRDFYDDRGFDYICSIEMIEAVGQKNFRSYFEKLYSLLTSDGALLIQAIVSDSKHGGADPWIDKYIFPNGTLPSHLELVGATEDLFYWESVDNIGPSYEHTLLEWWRNLESGYSKLQLDDPEKYTDTVLRMFKYYLHSCAALSRTRHMHTWQIVYTPKPSSQ
ncbi:MAG: cyclopropane fatty acyl phospholipid synthase [Patescibacteria group bacterium]